ncbi:MAG: hypothetical protein KAR14_10360 [Candidatus Aminicenantes bacterium]|nr:hypothetical protein [Candidatus Aminicenantes bacterium]
MKHFKTTIGLAIVILFGLSLFSQNQDFRRMGKNRAQNTQNRNFSLEKTRIVEGKITKVTLENNGRYGSPGIHLVVNDGKSDLSIHMGPEYFFKSKGITFKNGDSIKLNTFEGTFNKKVTLFASSIEVAGNVTLIRNRYGDPEWRRSADNRSGRGRGRGGSSYGGYRNR